MEPADRAKDMGGGAGFHYIHSNSFLRNRKLVAAWRKIGWMKRQGPDHACKATEGMRR